MQSQNGSHQYDEQSETYEEANGESTAERALYFSYVLALVRPGKTLQTFDTMRGPASVVGDLSEWSPDQLRTLADEGRRRLDSQSERFDRIRQTAQVVLPTGVALLVVVGTELQRITHIKSDGHRYASYVGWTVAVFSVLIGTLGSASILVSKAVFGAVLPILLSQQDGKELDQQIAVSYTQQSIAGEDTVNTRLTLQWWSVTFIAIGGLTIATLWALRVLI